MHHQKVIKTAVQFWELLEGAHIRFNILLQSKPSQGVSVPFDDMWDDWVEQVMNNFDWSEFDRDFLWKIVEKHSRINWKTRNFIDCWLDGIIAKNSVANLDVLVINQEKENKKERSKLADIHTVNYDNWVGIDRLEYRLGNVQTIVRDIVTSLEVD